MGILAAYVVPHPPLIIPMVGRGEERGIQRTINAYNIVAERIVRHNPDVIVLTSPHAPLYRDAFHLTTIPELSGTMAQFNAPKTQLDADINLNLVAALQTCFDDQGIPHIGSSWRDQDMDHATFIPLYFVQNAYERLIENTSEQGDTHKTGGPHSKSHKIRWFEHPSRHFAYPIIRLGLSGLSSETHQQVGHCIAQALEDTDLNAVIIASGDLSHKLLPSGPYGYVKEGPAFDREITRIFAANDLDQIFALDPHLCNEAAECGLRSFEIMAGALETTEHTGELLSYEGPFGVGYGVAAFECEATKNNELEEKTPRTATDPETSEHVASQGDKHKKPEHAASLSDEQEEAPQDAYIELARASLTSYITTGTKLAVPANLPPEMLHEKAGVFVSIHKYGNLRGCIGTIAATTNNVAEEIIDNAIAASTRDPRFPAVTTDEIPELEISVDVLHEPERIKDISQLDPKRYGVIASKGFRRGLLLPNLEGVDTAEEQVAIAKQKAGINPADTHVKLERFEVVRHEYHPQQ